MLSIVKELTFHAAHRLIEHEGLCQFFHGHSYRVAIHVRHCSLLPSECLDDVGRLVDFGEIKRSVGHFIAEHWDHATILSDRDPVLQAPNLEEIFPRRYVLPINPTAEVMALHLLDWCRNRFENTQHEVFRVEVWETDTARAVANLKSTD